MGTWWGLCNAGEVNSNPRTEGLQLEPKEETHGLPMAEIRTWWYLQGLNLSE